MNRIIKHLIITIALLIFSPQLFAVIFFDVDEFNFPNEGKKGIRVCVFDTKKQKYTDIRYYSYPISQYCYSQQGKNNKGLVTIYFKTKNTCVNNYYYQPDGYIIRNNINNFVIINGSKDQQKHKGILRSKEYQTTDIKKLKSSSENNSGDFILHYPELKTKHLRTTSKKEKGILGELATECTMIAYGYTKLDSKYEGNKGLDGVFVDNKDSPEKLILTESKFLRSSSVYKIWDNFKDNIIEDRIKIMLRKVKKDGNSNLKEAVENILHFIKCKPENIFKLIHRLKPDGSCGSDVKKCTLSIWEITTSYGLENFRNEKDFFVKVLQMLKESDECESDECKREILAIYNKYQNKKGTTDSKKEEKENNSSSPKKGNDDDKPSSGSTGSSFSQHAIDPLNIDNNNKNTNTDLNRLSLDLKNSPKKTSPNSYIAFNKQLYRRA